MFGFKNRVLQYLIASVTCGVLGGGLCLVFAVATSFADETFRSNERLLFLLPICGVLIVLLYDYMRRDNALTTDALFAFARGGSPVSGWIIPFIFLSTCLAYLTGGSVGRAGSALQIGGGVGAMLSRKNPQFAAVFVACGMAAGFTSILNTPIAGAVFGVEVLVLTGSDLLIIFPAFASSFITWFFGKLVQIQYADFHVVLQDSVSLGVLWRVVATAFVAMLAGRLFCLARKIVNKGFCLIKNKIIRVLVGSLLVIGITLLIGDTSYNGIGFEYVQAALNGHSASYAFLIKLILTVLTLGCGIRGGEIAPTIFIGATSCFAFGSLIGLSPELAAAIGIVGALASVTNCSTAIFIYGLEAINCSAGVALYFSIAALVAYLFSGDGGLYQSQYKGLKSSATHVL